MDQEARSIYRRSQQLIGAWAVGSGGSGGEVEGGGCLVEVEVESGTGCGLVMQGCSMWCSQL